jgi:Polysaccharide lyase
VVFDHWYDWRWQIKWSGGSDGFVNFWLDGQQIAAFTGSSISAAAGAPYLEWGFYGGVDPAHNEVMYGNLRKNP